jgi:hypothetical protein
VIHAVTLPLEINKYENENPVLLYYPQVLCLISTTISGHCPFKSRIAVDFREGDSLGVGEPGFESRDWGKFTFGQFCNPPMKGKRRLNCPTSSILELSLPVVFAATIPAPRLFKLGHFEVQGTGQRPYTNLEALASTAVVGDVENIHLQRPPPLSRPLEYTAAQCGKFTLSASKWLNKTQLAILR